MRWYVVVSTVGESVGILLGMGVVLPRMYFGMAVGRALGICVVWLDVGTSKLAKVTVRLKLDTVAGLLRVTSAPLTEMTVVP